MKQTSFSFPPSVQSDLFNYLKPQQREAMRPYLRLIKPQYQEKLCVSLLDYLEGHGLEPLQQPVLSMLQQHIIEACNLHPLTSRQPKSIGTVIRQLLPGLIPGLTRNPLPNQEMPHQVRHEGKNTPSSPSFRA